MKRATSAERETPKRRRKSRARCTTSPSSRQGTNKSLSIGEAKASSELFQKAIHSRKMAAPNEPFPIAHSALQPAAELSEKPPASSRLENLESVVHKLRSSSGSADMDMSDDEPPVRDKLTTARKASPDKRRDKEERQKDDGEEALMTIDEYSVEKESDKGGDQTETMDLEIVAPKTPEPKMGADEPKAEDVKVVATATPRRGTGASADDAMELDPSPSAQLEHEHQLSQQVASSQASSGQDDTPDDVGTVVTSEWLLQKLAGLTPDTLSSGRDAIIQELQDMKGEIERLPRAEMQSQHAGNPAARRLQMVDTLIAPQLTKLPPHTWRIYKSKLLRLCAGSVIHNMDHRQRLEKVKEIVYLPEEMELVRKGDTGRIACAIRVCATVTEILGRDDEIVPQEMAEWVTAELKDLLWKAKVTSVWRKYWPETSDVETA